MRIGARTTLTTSLLLALTLGIFGFVSLRSTRSQRLQQLEEQAGGLARALAAAIEPRFAELVAASPDERARFERAAAPFRLELLDARDAPQAYDPPTGDPRRERLRRLLVAKTAVVENTTVDGHATLFHLEPVRGLEGPEIPVVGGVQLSLDVAFLGDEFRRATIETVTSMLALIVFLSLAIYILLQRGLGKPIDKLVAGIDDVAKGDLSHALLAEREDEIGALASRFNEMTQSLRDARAETVRGHDAKLTLEAQLRHSEKMATVGQFAAEIAHEVGTPLNVVSGRARAIAKKANDPVAVEKNATIVAEQAARIARIIQRLLDLARRRVGDGERGPVNIRKLADETLEVLEHQLDGAKIARDVDVEEGLDGVPGIRDQLQQVLLNLVVNAMQAMKDGGKVSIRGRRVLRRRPGLEMEGEQHFAVIEVIDDGPGIPAEDRERIFEPFYTSKGDSGGTGLGLVVAQGIAREHDGWLECDVNPEGHGAVFRFVLPAVEAPTMEVSGERRATPRLG